MNTIHGIIHDLANKVKMKTLDEAIRYEEMVVDVCESTARECAEKHKQLAKGLWQLQGYMK